MIQPVNTSKFCNITVDFPALTKSYANIAKVTTSVLAMSYSPINEPIGFVNSKIFSGVEIKQSDWATLNQQRDQSCAKNKGTIFAPNSIQDIQAVLSRKRSKLLFFR